MLLLLLFFCLLCCYVNVSRGFASPVNSSLWFNSLTIILHMFTERSFIVEPRLAIFSANAVFFILAISKIHEFTTWGLMISALVHAIMFVFEYRKDRHSTFTNLLFGFAMGHLV